MHTVINIEAQNNPAESDSATLVGQFEIKKEGKNKVRKTKERRQPRRKKIAAFYFFLMQTWVTRSPYKKCHFNDYI
jgi:hypothetical protein